MLYWCLLVCLLFHLNPLITLNETTAALEHKLSKIAPFPLDLLPLLNPFASTSPKLPSPPTCSTSLLIGRYIPPFSKWGIWQPVDSAKLCPCQIVQVNETEGIITLQPIPVVDWDLGVNFAKPSQRTFDESWAGVQLGENFSPNEVIVPAATLIKSVDLIPVA